MAVLYTRIYTYTGQNSWTPGTRSVPWSEFAASGDTDREIGQLVSIRYEHYHASTSHKDWELQGRLVFSGGSVESDSVCHTIGTGDAVKYANSFAALPEISQFNSISAVETLYSGSSGQTGSPYLTWHATAAHPIRLIVAFYEEPPWVYHPQIEEFTLIRGTSSGAQDDGGTRALLSLRLSLASTAYASSSTLKLYYSTGAVSTSSPSINLSSYVSALLSGVTNNYSYITTSFSADYDWNFLLVFSCLGEEASATATLPNSFVALHISPCSTGGVSIGDLSTAQEGVPKFEVHHPAYFYGGIAQIGGGSGSALESMGVKTGVVPLTSVGSPKSFDTSIDFGSFFDPNGSLCVIVGLVIDSADSSAYRGQCSAAAMDIGPNSFTLRVYNNSAATLKLGAHYIAIGTTAGG